jgi:NAD(P)H-flavin reductase
VTCRAPVDVRGRPLPAGRLSSTFSDSPHRFRARLEESVALTSDTKNLKWNIVGAKRFQFIAGQFISALVEVGTRTEIRPYSIASPPRDDLSFELCINRVKGGYVSNYLCDLPLDSVVEFKGPYGSFVVTQPIDRDQVFLATGTGVAPFRSMLMDLLAKEIAVAHDIWLIFGVRFAEGLLYQKDFERLQRTYSCFHFVPVVSRPSREWRSATGHVQDQLRRLFAERNDFRAYVCGVRSMVDEVRAILSNEFGLETDQIRFENFV